MVRQAPIGPIAQIDISPAPISPGGIVMCIDRAGTPQGAVSEGRAQHRARTSRLHRGGGECSGFV